MSVHLTELEAELMRKIPEDNFYEEGFNSALWTNIFLHDTLEMPTTTSRGVLGSLVKKGFLVVYQDGESYWTNSYFQLEPAGIEWLKEFSGIAFDEDGRKDRKGLEIV